MHATPFQRPNGSSAKPLPATRPHSSRLLQWGQAVAGGLVVCLLLSGCGGDDNNGSDGKAREARCAR